jgi:hypothetical protein
VDTGQQNRITHNSIFGNTGPGIYLGPFVGQPVPAPTLTFTPGAGSTAALAGTLKASPNLAYTVEIYSNPSALAPGQEQGKTFVQEVTVNTDGTGKGTFSVTDPIGYYVATASDPSGNTSAFSNAVGSQTPAKATSQTAVSSSANPSTVGQPMTFTAVVTAPGYQGTPTGTVTFSIDGQAQSPVPLSIVGGVDEAQFVTTTLSVGQHSVTATYSGDANVSPSNGSLPAETVTARSLQQTTTTLTSSLNPSSVAQPVTLTAVVTASGYQGTPTGTVTFSIDGQQQSPVPLSVVGGVDEAQFVTSSLSVGQHSVTAAYSGDANVTPSSGSLPTETVSAASLAPTTTTLTSSLNPSTLGQPVTFTAFVSAQGSSGMPTGQVIFTIDGHAESPVALHQVGGRDHASFSIGALKAGTHTITASYDGDAAFAPSSVLTPLDQVVHSAAGDPPRVISVKRFGIHMQPTVLVLTFSTALDAAFAETPLNYVLRDPSGRRIAIDAAVYNPAALTVTLRPRDRVSIHHDYHLTVMGKRAGAVTGADGTPLDGVDNGDPGSDFVTTLSWRNLVLTPAEIAKYDKPKRAHPAGALSLPGTKKAATHLRVGTHVGKLAASHSGR